MGWFRCFIRGENFPGEMVGESGPVGFYVTRFVEADDIADVEAIALQTLRNELQPPSGYTPSGQTRVYFEEIEELAAMPASDVPQGFVWYPMGEADSDE